MIQPVAERTPTPLAEAHPQAPPQPNARWHAWRGLLWGEWFSHSKVLLVFLAAWLVAVWTLPLFTSSVWLLLLGGLYALIAGPLHGGGDIIEGCEEFSFSLPPTRGERYTARLLVGGGTLLGISAMNIIALGLDLPQMLTGLYVHSGLIQPQPQLKPGLLYALVIALPIAVFAFGFTLSSVTHSRALVLVSWFWGMLGGLALLQAGFWYEELVHDELNGRFACVLLLLASASVLAAGYRSFCRKEVGKPSAPLILPGLWWLWVLLFIAGLGLAIALAGSLRRHFPQLLQG